MDRDSQRNKLGSSTLNRRREEVGDEFVIVPTVLSMVVNTRRNGNNGFTTKHIVVNMNKYLYISVFLLVPIDIKMASSHA